MAVEIRILSGARQGQTVRLDQKEFHVGAEPGYEVRFDPLEDPGARDRGVWFFLRDDGWQARHVGVGEVLVNSEPLSGTQRIRHGDVVRLSEEGPDFVFRIVTHATATVTESAPPAPLVTDIVAPLSLVGETPVRLEGAAPERVPLTLGTPPTPAPIEQAPARAAPAPDANRTLMLMFGGIGLALLFLVVVVVAVLAVVLFRSQNGGKNNAEERQKAEIVEKAKRDQEFADRREAERQQAERQQAERERADRERADRERADRERMEREKAERERAEKERAEKEKVSKTPEARFADAAANLRDAVYLLELESGDVRFPHATAFAVSDDLLVTTAREALHLAKMQREKQFKVFATQPAAQRRIAVQEIRLNTVFTTLAEKQTDWIYFNFAVLKAGEKLPKAAPLATAEDLGALEAGLPLAAFGFTHAGEKITRFDEFSPQLSLGKVYIITAPENLPGHPRLIHFRGPIPKFAYGSPVVNQQGRVVAVFGESAPPPAGDAAAALQDLHFATVLSPETIQLSSGPPDAKLWTVPSASAPKP